MNNDLIFFIGIIVVNLIVIAYIYFRENDMKEKFSYLEGAIEGLNRDIFDLKNSINAIKIQFL